MYYNHNTKPANVQISCKLLINVWIWDKQNSIKYLT